MWSNSGHFEDYVTSLTCFWQVLTCPVLWVSSTAEGWLQDFSADFGEVFFSSPCLPAPTFPIKQWYKLTEKINRLSPTFPHGPTFLSFSGQRGFSLRLLGPVLQPCRSTASWLGLYTQQPWGVTEKKIEILPPPHPSPCTQSSGQKERFLLELFQYVPIAQYWGSGPVQ